MTSRRKTILAVQHPNASTLATLNAAANGERTLDEIVAWVATNPKATPADRKKAREILARAKREGLTVEETMRKHDNA